MASKIDEIRTQIIEDKENQEFTQQGYKPLFVADPTAKILIVGQAPGLKAQESEIVWGDASGERLIKWLGIDETTFRNPQNIAILPMDFYYPGKGKSGDLPPRTGFAKQWHPLLLGQMPQLELTILAGQYAVNYYLPENKKRNLTETVRSYSEYLPLFFPIVHPSPLNFRWLAKNPWFENEAVPKLKRLVHKILDK